MTRALVDVDGVLSDFNAHVIATVPGGTDLVEAELVTYSAVFDLLRPQQAKFMKDEMLNDPDWWGDLPVKPWAREGIAELRKQVDEVVFVTSPWWSCKGWEHVRRAWLYYNFDAKTKDVAPLPRKELISGEWFLDDKWAHVRDWIGEQVQRRRRFEPIPRAFLFDAPYNQEVPTIGLLKQPEGVARLTWETYLADPAAFHVKVELL